MFWLKINSIKLLNLTSQKRGSKKDIIIEFSINLFFPIFYCYYYYYYVTQCNTNTILHGVSRMEDFLSSDQKYSYPPCLKPASEMLLTWNLIAGWPYIILKNENSNTAVKFWRLELFDKIKIYTLNMLM